MEEKEFKERNDHGEIFSKAVRAGKRTYFFDVKATRGDELYLTITESKKRFSDDNGKFTYEKHKLFLYREDFDKFLNGLHETIGYIDSGEFPEPEVEEGNRIRNEFTDFDFDELGDDTGNKH